MECPSPPVDFEALFNARRAQSTPASSTPLAVASRRRKRAGMRPHRDVPRTVTLRIGFLMDNVESVRDLKKHFQQLQYVEDPSYSPFVGASLVKSYKGDTLVIEGENLNLASDETDVNVTIGTRPCNVTSLAATQLVCTPPEVQPPGTDEIGIKTESRLPLVVVRVGQNLRFPIGYLRYEVVKPYTFPPEAIGGIAGGVLFFAVVIAVIVVIFRRKSTQAEREYKRIQIQMDTLESNVRSECKQGAPSFPLVVVSLMPLLCIDIDRGHAAPFEHRRDFRPLPRALSRRYSARSRQEQGSNRLPTSALSKLASLRFRNRLPRQCADSAARRTMWLLALAVSCRPFTYPVASPRAHLSRL